MLACQGLSSRLESVKVAAIRAGEVPPGPSHYGPCSDPTFKQERRPRRSWPWLARAGTLGKGNGSPGR